MKLQLPNPLRLYTSRVSNRPWAESDFASYLLGGLRESRRFRLEEDCLRDEDVFQRMELAEDMLVDRYVTKRLNWLARIRFERYYLKSPSGREKVEFARELIAAVTPAGLTAKHESLLPAFVLTGVTLIAVGLCIWLGIANRKRQAEIASLRVELSEARQELGRPLPPAEEFELFVLGRGTERGLGEPVTIPLLPGVRTVYLIANVAPGSSSQYSATLTHGLSEVVARDQLMREGQYVRFKVATSLLIPGGTYLLLLKGGNGFDREFQFTVSR